MGSQVRRDLPAEHLAVAAIVSAIRAKRGEFALEDFARRSPRQLVEEDHVARHLVARKVLLT
jgi:hypothetical protein